MIHQLLDLTRQLIVFDTETTGLDTKECRIVELGFQLWTADGLQKEYRTLVNPYVPIPVAATKVHGITDGKMRACQVCGLLSHDDATTVDHSFKVVPTFAQLAPSLAKGFRDCDYAGKNVRFDLRILASEFKRAKVEWNYNGARVVDADRLEALLNPRSLGHLYKKYVGEDLADAHSALADVRATTTVIECQLQTWTERELPRDLDKLHELQWPGFLCDEGQFKMIGGVATCCFGKKWNGKPMRDIDVGFFDWILQNDFPADVKALAANAKLGKFPV